MKTCFLTSSIIKKALLLLERYSTVIENEYEQTTELSEFVKKHVSIDSEINSEKVRSRSIQLIFLILDIVISILI